MTGKKITIVISQAQGKHPVRREFEEQLAMSLMLNHSVEVSIVPHLYDLSADHTGMTFLQSIPGDIVFLAWLFPRAARWTLDRQGVKGHEGITLLKAEGEDDEDEDLDDESSVETEEKESKAIGAADVPNRKIYCIDLRAYDDAQIYLEEIHRIANEATVQTVDLMQWIQGNPKQEQLERYLQPRTPSENSNGNGQPAETAVKRRWYPVIDYSRCTNCMECIDFCLFGVYGVDHQERILVEEQDSCKKGCPACSRVCPENAIIFPGHKTPTIAGAPGDVGDFKIDLSKLFGAPEGINAAVAERDAELIADGREAVGMAVGIPKRQTQTATKTRDELDDLMDDFDNLDL